MNCPNLKCCTCRTATARELTRGDAEFIMKRMAEDFRGAMPTLSVEHSEEMAMSSILTKRPKLLARCDACGSEWFE